MNEHYLRQHYEHLRSQYMEEARRDRLKAEVLRKAARQRRWHPVDQFATLAGKVLVGLRQTLPTPIPVEDSGLPLMEDCVGLESS